MAAKFRIILIFLFIFYSTGFALAYEIVIPVMVGQTGASANFGNPELDAYTLAVEEWNARGGINGKKIVLKVEDTQTSQRQIVTAFQRLAIDSPAAILGPTWLDGFPAVIQPARQKGILLITPSAAREAFSEKDRSWPITFYHNSTRENQALINGINERGFKRIALIYEQEPFAEMIRQLALARTEKIVSDVGVQGGETDFHAVLTKMKSTKPDILIVFVWDEKSLLALLKQVRQHIPEIKLATVHDGEGWLDNPTFSPVIPQLIYTKFIVADNSFAERFKKHFGREPLLTASNAYDAINALLTARQNGKSTAQEIREYMTTQELNTVTFGKFKFGTDGAVPSKVKIVEYP